MECLVSCDEYPCAKRKYWISLAITGFFLAVSLIRFNNGGEKVDYIT